VIADTTEALPDVLRNKIGTSHHVLSLHRSTICSRFCLAPVHCRVGLTEQFFPLLPGLMLRQPNRRLDFTDGAARSAKCVISADPGAKPLHLRFGICASAIQHENKFVPSPSADQILRPARGLQFARELAQKVVSAKCPYASLIV